MLLALAAVAVAALCKAADEPASAARTAGQAAEHAAAERPVVALLLPLNEPDFAPPARAVLAGCKEALALVDGDPLIELVSTNASPDQSMAGYKVASERGASIVVGPMTRSGVTALAESRKIPTLTIALNTPERPMAMPENLYTFSLSVDAEARQVARFAWDDDLQDAVVVQSSSALSKRAGRAFANEWSLLGGKVSDVMEFSTQADLTRIHDRLSISEADVVFLAANAEGARTVRPYLNNQIPVFATSQINSGRVDALKNLDLNGIRFVEMPWLAQPDNLTAMIFPRPDELAPELQRFYALGIDACRIANEFLHRRLDIHLEGVTGTLTRRPTGYVRREAIQAIFRDGAGVAIVPRTR